MINPNDIVVGLDIGTTKIACFIGQRDESGKIRIIGFGKTDSHGVERGVVKNIMDTAKSITKAVETASEQAGVEVKDVYVGIAGQHIKSQQNIGTLMIPADHKYIYPEDVERLIREQYNIMLNPGEEIIHIFPQNYVVDGEELSPEVDPIGVAGKQLKANFHIVTGNTNNLRNIHDSVERAGLRISGVVLEPVASAFAVLDQTDKDAGVALVDIGGGTTDIAIFHEGVIRYTTVLPYAGNVITNDIKEGCKILRSQAETLKTRFGSCLPQNVSENDIISIPGLRSQPAREISMRTLADIIHARTETIIEQINFEIHKSHLEKHIFAGIVLTGGGAQLRHIKELTEFLSGIDTRIGLPDEHLVRDTPDELVNTMYATGIGLVLYGFDKIDQAQLHNGIDDETVSEPEPEPVHIEEPQTLETPPVTNPFGDLEEPGETLETADEEETPKTRMPFGARKKKNKDSESKGKPNLGKQIMNSIDKYFNKVFNDSAIRNEGDEERDI